MPCLARRSGNTTLSIRPQQQQQHQRMWNENIRRRSRKVKTSQKNLWMNGSDTPFFACLLTFSSKPAPNILTIHATHKPSHWTFYSMCRFFRFHFYNVWAIIIYPTRLSYKKNSMCNTRSDRVVSYGWIAGKKRAMDRGSLPHEKKKNDDSGREEEMEVKVGREEWSEGDLEVN